MLEDENGAKQKVENLFQVSDRSFVLEVRENFVFISHNLHKELFSTKVRFQNFMKRQFKKVSYNTYSTC